MINMRNRDSILGRLTQSSRDLHFERSLCSHGSNTSWFIFPTFQRLVSGLLYKAEAAVWATLMQTEALQHRLCSSVMCQYNGESLELLESGLNVPEKSCCDNFSIDFFKGDMYRPLRVGSTQKYVV